MAIAYVRVPDEDKHRDCWILCENDECHVTDYKPRYDDDSCPVCSWEPE